MILTLSDDQKNIVFNRLIVKDEQKEEIERLHDLYKTPNFELGYLQHGPIFFSREKPNETLVTSDNIQVFNSYQWGENGINGMYPVELYTTRAKNTLIMIRQLLGIEHDHNFKLSSFFAESSKEVTASGILVERPFDLTLQIKKLEHILASREIALSLLKDAFFDLYLFVDLLTKVELESQRIEEPTLFEPLYAEAQENTPILNLAKDFARLKSDRLS